MPRRRTEEISTAGQDSFLDVVTNIVGILIILVMVVGGRVQHIVLSAKPSVTANQDAIRREVDELDAKAAAAEGEIEELAAQEIGRAHV